MEMTRDEIIFRVRGSGCKMLDRLDLEVMSKEDIIKVLKKSCCKVYEKLCKEGRVEKIDVKE